jgi:UDP-sulfoquinovose synthase
MILGGDGFIGHPTALYLSAQGHDIWIIDDLSRRTIDGELGVQSLTPIEDTWQRCRRWELETGRNIQFDCVNLSGERSSFLLEYISRREIDAVIHLAEQRAAPYSMKTREHKIYTVNRNVAATHNLLASCAELSEPPHVIHIGSMGVYGYGASSGEIPEGYLRVFTEPPRGHQEYLYDHLDGNWTIDGVLPSFEILHPTRPGSVYHMTKCLDQTMFEFYARNDGLQITDLHQGIVYGTQTTETEHHPDLINRFDYCGDFGTVLNRFIVQAVCGYPLTVHGTGGQTRAFIHIRDSMRCIELALLDPPARGDRVRILNQMTECHRVRDLAKLIAERTGAEIAYTDNPRNEADENDLMVANDSLLKMGLEPTTLADGLLDEIQEVATKYKHRVDLDNIPCRSVWTREQKPGVP